MDANLENWQLYPAGVFNITQRQFFTLGTLDSIAEYIEEHSAEDILAQSIRCSILGQGLAGQELVEQQELVVQLELVEQLLQVELPYSALRQQVLMQLAPPVVVNCCKQAS